VRSFLFAMFQGGGNVPLILPIVRRLAARGHSVRVLAGPIVWIPRPPPPDALVDAARDAGATATAIDTAGANAAAAAPQPRGLLRGWSPKRLSSARNLSTAMRWTSVWVEAVASVLQREEFDVVVADNYLLGAAIAAERAGLPHALLVHKSTYPLPLPGFPPPGTGFALARGPRGNARDRLWAAAFDRVLVRDALPLLNAARAAAGLMPAASLSEQYRAAACVLVLSSSSFDLAHPPVPENVRYTGTPFDGGPAQPWSPPWPTGDRRPLVLVSFSTLNQGQATVLRRVLAAIAGLEVRALITLGPALDRGNFDAPPNAWLETFVPHDAVLPMAAAVVSQCGLGTVTKALAHGVPLVCLPLRADQPDNAARVVACGAGSRLSSNAGVAAIRAAISQLLNDPSYRQAARRISSTMAQEDGASSAADALAAVSPPLNKSRSY
jgi:MGT family glycosyltransferase